MFYLLHGPESFMRSRAIAEIKAQVGAPDLVDLNTSIFDQGVAYAELVHACDAIPFLSDRRLVIVEGLVTRLTPGKGQSRGKRSLSERDQADLDHLVAHIPHLPPTTDLVLSEEDLVVKSHPLLKAAEGGHGVVRAFPMLRDAELERWVRTSAKEKGLRIEPQALAELLIYVGNNLRLLDMELDKLATYVGGGRLATLSDVHRLVSYVREESIFDLVDAIGQRDSGRAMRLFHQLLEEGKDPLYVFAMITRQFRLLLQTKFLAGQRASERQFMDALGVRHEFIVKKMLGQSRNFSLERLKAIYRELQRLDVAIKTGQVDAGLGLDVLIANICATSARTSMPA